MKIVDANVLLYAVNSASEHHRASVRWLDNALSGADGVGFAWVPLLAFLRLTTRDGLFPRPLSTERAIGQITDWLSASTATVVGPTARHIDILSTLIGQTGTGGNLVSDAHVAALAIEHRAGIVSYDNDFARFGVQWHRPDELL